jgi:hypothetical protein
MNRILAAAVALALCAPAYADSLPPGLQCDIAVTMTTEPGHKVKTMQARSASNLSTTITGAFFLKTAF